MSTALTPQHELSSAAALPKTDVKAKRRGLPRPSDSAFPPLTVRPAEAERLLRISHSHLYELLNSGELESVLRGKRTRLISMRSIRRVAGLDEDEAG
jgi:hypothetical protein